MDEDDGLINANVLEIDDYFTGEGSGVDSDEDVASGDWEDDDDGDDLTEGSGEDVDNNDNMDYMEGIVTRSLHIMMALSYTLCTGSLLRAASVCIKTTLISSNYGRGRGVVSYLYNWDFFVMSLSSKNTNL